MFLNSGVSGFVSRGLDAEDFVKLCREIGREDTDPEEIDVRLQYRQAESSLKVATKGPCTQIVYALAPKYLYRDYFKAKVYTVWAHGPLGIMRFSTMGM